MKNLNIRKLDVVISVSSLILSFIFYNLKNNCNFFLGILLLLINFYLVYKFRNSKKLFLLFIMILYFNYSFVVTHYLSKTPTLLNNLYLQLTNINTLKITIIIQIIFFNIMNLLIPNITYNKKDVLINNDDNNKYYGTTTVILDIVLIIILMYHIISGINHNTALLEYSILLFIFSFYYGKKSNINKVYTEIIMLIFIVYSILIGQRISVLQFLLADFIINYLDIINVKILIFCFTLGIILFTFFGLYGDFKDYGYNLKDLTFEYTMNEIKNRKFALDTSVSAYFNTASMIELRKKYSTKDRLSNAKKYFIDYTILNKKYENNDRVDILIRDYQVNYGGGFITGWFYFWFGKIGILLISVYISFLLSIVLRKQKTIYQKLLAIFIISTAPRWYLYEPTLLFRGIIIFSVFYFILVNLMFKKRYK